MKKLWKAFIHVRDFVKYRFKENPAKKPNYFIIVINQILYKSTANGQALVFAVSLETML